jgi:hypothetical protein
MDDIPTIYKSLEEDLYSSETITINGVKIEAAELHFDFEHHARGSVSFSGCDIDVTADDVTVLQQLAHINTPITVETDDRVWELQTVGELLYEVGEEMAVDSSGFSIGNLRKVE